MKGSKYLLIIAGSAMLSTSMTVNAGPILSAVAGVINSGGPGFGSLDDTFNQAGLAVGYTSGVTDFDTYIASNPLHTNVFSGFEWFSNGGSTSASVTYDLGMVQTIDALALWNEGDAGIGLLNLFSSIDGVSFAALASGLMPTDNPLFPALYGAEVFGFGAVSAQFIRFDMSSCPQPPAGFNSCAIGEVAYRGGSSSNEPPEGSIPEPGTIALLGISLAGLGLARPKRKASLE